MEIDELNAIRDTIRSAITIVKHSDEKIRKLEEEAATYSRDYYNFQGQINLQKSIICTLEEKIANLESKFNRISCIKSNSDKGCYQEAKAPVIVTDEMIKVMKNPCANMMDEKEERKQSKAEAENHLGKNLKSTSRKRLNEQAAPRPVPLGKSAKELFIEQGKTKRVTPTKEVKKWIQEVFKDKPMKKAYKTKVANGKEKKN